MCPIFHCACRAAQLFRQSRTASLLSFVVHPFAACFLLLFPAASRDRRLCFPLMASAALKAKENMLYKNQQNIMTNCPVVNLPVAITRNRFFCVRIIAGGESGAPPKAAGARRKTRFRRAIRSGKNEILCIPGEIRGSLSRKHGFGRSDLGGKWNTVCPGNRNTNFHDFPAVFHVGFGYASFRPCARACHVSLRK